MSFYRVNRRLADAVISCFGRFMNGQIDGWCKFHDFYIFWFESWFYPKKITSLRLDQDGATVKFDVSNLSIFKFRT